MAACYRGTKTALNGSARGQTKMGKQPTMTPKLKLKEAERKTLLS